jgi:hypothetical protein
VARNWASHVGRRVFQYERRPRTSLTSLAPPADALYMPSIFISYRRTQSAAVDRAAAALQAAGADVFVDRDAIDPLADFPTRIAAGIDRSHVVIVWWSADYAESEFCLHEFRRAWQHARRQSSDVGRRIWVLNPETTGVHVFAGELAAQNYLKRPVDGQEGPWAADFVRRATDLVAEGPLADERRAEPAPQRHGVPDKSATFTGRGAELMRIHSALHPVQIDSAGAAPIVQTHGIGGVGKTELAAAYANDFAAAYPGGIFWLNLAGWTPGAPAQEDEAQAAWLRAVDGSLARAPTLLRQVARDADGKVLPPGVVRERLAEHVDAARDDGSGPKPSLWILDNLPDLTPLDARARIVGFLRAAPREGRTLITTRDSRPIDGAVPISLDVLSDDDSLRLLARYRPERAAAERDAMRALIAETGGLTLALVLLGEYAREAVGGYPRVLEQVREKGQLQRIEEIGRTLSGQLGQKARGVVSTLALSIDPLSADARELLSLASLCAANKPIPDALLALAFGGRDREDSLNSALPALLRASLLSRRTSDPDAVVAHPMVAAAARVLLPFDEPALRQRLADALLARLHGAADVRQHAALRNDVEQARELAPPMRDPTGVRLLSWVGAYEEACGNYPAELDVKRKALALAKAELGDEHPDTLASMNNLAGALHASGDLAGAQALHEQVVGILRSVLGEDDPVTLRSLNNLAAALHARGDLGGARAMYQQVVDGRRRVLGDEDPSTLTSLNNLATVASDQGDLATARALHERVLDARRRVLGEEHPSTVTSMNNLALTLRAQGDLAGARALQERVLDARCRMPGEEHPSTLTARNNLALTLSAQGDLAGSHALHQQVLSAQRRLLGDDHRYTLMSMSNLAPVTWRLGDRPGAIALMRAAAEGLTARLGHDHPDARTCRESLARMLASDGPSNAAVET